MAVKVLAPAGGERSILTQLWVDTFQAHLLSRSYRAVDFAGCDATRYLTICEVSLQLGQGLRALESARHSLVCSATTPVRLPGQLSGSEGLSELARTLAAQIAQSVGSARVMLADPGVKLTRRESAAVARCLGALFESYRMLEEKLP